MFSLATQQPPASQKAGNKGTKSTQDEKVKYTQVLPLSLDEREIKDGDKAHQSLATSY